MFGFSMRMAGIAGYCSASARRLHALALVGRRFRLECPPQNAAVLL